MNKKPKLNEVDLQEALAKINGRVKGVIVITMSTGQWDIYLQGIYDMGGILIELNDYEFPIKAYQKWIN